MLGDRSTEFGDDQAGYTAPVGALDLVAIIATDPPLPEELTNAIGLFMDHLEDVAREVPGAVFADTIEMRGPGVQALVDTETGHPTLLPYTLARSVAEDVFRTLATESAIDRLLNPGLPPAEVHRVVAVCCAVVAVLRSLDAAQIVLTAP